MTVSSYLKGLLTLIVKKNNLNLWILILCPKVFTAVSARPSPSFPFLLRLGAGAFSRRRRQSLRQQMGLN